ncbi:MAG: hypothetical protein ABIR46_02515 [Candidatus Saccharimonadales bacterium]
MSIENMPQINMTHEEANYATLEDMQEFFAQFELADLESLAKAAQQYEEDLKKGPHEV